tara:strand:- start:31596 stop:32288 length:693 start_codon:yes stop_codon:yes gene_type:complete
MKSYPYIGQFQHAIKLFYGENRFILIKEGHGSNRHESKYTNITLEYLQNTYGEVVSPEHAEFIIELCLENLINFAVNNARRKYFAINGGKLYFFCLEIDASNIGSKKITIPLPPKEPLKNAGDNLILGCEDSKCDEWPKVGSIVTWGNKSVKGEVKALSDGLAWIKNEYGNYCSEYVSSLQKPKTPEEELRDDIMQTIHDDVYNRAYEKQSLEVFANALMSKYNITKKPQ